MQDGVVKTEEVEGRQVTVAPVEAQPKFESGLTRRINMELKTTPTVVVEKEGEEPKSSYDYSFMKDLSEDDFKENQELKEKDEALYHKIMSYKNDMKKNQRLVSVRETELNKLKSTPADEKLRRYEEFVDGLRKDTLGTYKRFQSEFELPESDFLERQVSSGGDVQTRLEQWQESELTPRIEKKFKLDGGTFVYDPSQAYKAGTPSYDYRIETEKQEKAWTSEYESSMQKQRDVADSVKKQTDEDLKYLRETYFPNEEFESPEKADEAFISYLTKLDEIENNIKQGKFDAVQNPFALRNIFRGVNFDTLAKAMVDKAVANIHKQYNAKGLYLPANELPKDATQIKGAPVTQPNENGKKFSPMHRQLNRHNS